MAHWKYPDNCWIGITAENKQRYHERWAILQKIPAAIKFVSVEPMLSYVTTIQFLEQPDWIICGAETGSKARAMNLEWARCLKEECRANNIPFFFKKAGNKKPIPDDLMIREYPKTN